MNWRSITKKILSVSLVAIMLFALVACGAKPADETTGNTTGGTTAGNTTPEVTTGNTEIVELKAITMGSEPANGMDEFYEQLDALTIPDLGCTVRFTYIPWGDEKNQISRAIVAKEYDIYVGGAWTDFATFATQNAFADMKPYLEDCPDLVEHYTVNDVNILERLEINGGIYGIPQLDKPLGGGSGFLYREDLRKEWGLDPIEDFADVEAYLYKAAEEFPSVSMINDNRFFDLILYNMIADKYTTIGEGLVVEKNKSNPEVLVLYELPEYKAALEMAKKWYDDGIVDHDILAAQNNATTDTNNLMQANEKPLEFSNHYDAVSSGYVFQIKASVPEAELGWLSYSALHDDYYMPVVSTTGTSMISIGYDCEHADIVMKLLEKAHTDRTYYDLLAYGVDGIMCNLGDDNTVNYNGIDQANIKPCWTALKDGYMARETTYPDDWAAVTKTERENGQRIAFENGYAPYSGFTLLKDKVTTELSNMETVKAQYITPLQCGITNDIDADIAKVMEELNKAGFEAYKVEVERQLEEFWKK